jgi:putative tricarboxylic transport membrane protein
MNDFIRKGDFWSGLVLAALGAYIVNAAWGWDYMAEDGPGAGFFPMWYGGLMVVLSLLLVAGAVLKADPAASGKRINWSELRRVAMCWGAFVVCIALLQPLGFILSFGLMTWFLVSVLFRKPAKVAIPTAIVAPLFFYAVFTLALDISLPAGHIF